MHKPIHKVELFPGRDVLLFRSIKEHMSNTWWCEVVERYSWSSKAHHIDCFYLIMTGDDEQDIENAKDAARFRSDWKGYGQ